MFKKISSNILETKQKKESNMITQINGKEVYKMLNKKNSFKLVDVLSKEHYEKEHIAGAISLPEEEIETEAEKVLDKNDMIAVYCASEKCQASARVANKLCDMGYKHVLEYSGGLEDYKKEKLPLEGKKVSYQTE